MAVRVEHPTRSDKRPDGPHDGTLRGVFNVLTGRLADSHRSRIHGAKVQRVHSASGDGDLRRRSAPGRDEGAVDALTAEDSAASERERRLRSVLSELDGLIGLSSVKQLVRELHAFIEIQRRRAEQRLAVQPTVLHMVFKGNPGTGKTTVARVLGKLFQAMEVLPKGHLVECERADLVGEYIGHTAQRTREYIRKAMGGVLFVDEAYSLARGGEKDFGKEAIDTLVKAIEDHKTELVVILAGYREEMEFFLSSNPGLRSRFPIQLEFPDYTCDELLQIAHYMCEQRQYRLSPAAARRLLKILQKQTAGNSYFGNARFVRNVIERSIRRQALRLVDRRVLTRAELMTLEASDVWEAASQ